MFFSIVIIFFKKFIDNNKISRDVMFSQPLKILKGFNRSNTTWLQHQVVLFP
jgi:hypothetical protein